MNWFRDLTGFDEGSAAQVREQLFVAGDRLHSRANGRSWAIGQLDTPNLADLRRRGREALPSVAGALQVDAVQADVRSLLGDARHAGALFQVASQFNLLEMPHPHVTPDEGVTNYEHDHTQGPACAMAAGAATLYRNHFVPLGGQPGQTADRQVDCLAGMGKLLGQPPARLWTMRNGYAMASAAGLQHIRQWMAAATPEQVDGLRAALRVGLHEDVEVTRGPQTGHLVTQLFGSAVPVSYSGQSAAAWEPFARCVLQASYEATLWAGVLNATRTGRREVFLTLLGGGAFGNPLPWILDGLAWALQAVQGAGLVVHIVSYAAPSPELRDFVAAR